MRSLHTYRKKAHFYKNRFSSFLLPLFFILLVDSALSYIFPIVVEENVKSLSLLGIIMAISSVVGFIFDILIPRFFNNSRWYTLFTIGIVSSIFFPISLLFGIHFESVIFFILASSIWGIYFEFLSFSQQDFVVEEERKSEYTKAWGIIHTLWQATTILGPIIASVLLSYSIFHLSLNILAIQAIALTLSVLIIFKNNTHNSRVEIVSGVKGTLYLIKEIKAMTLIAKNILPIMYTSFITFVGYSAYWTLGGLFGKELGGESSWIVLGILNLSILIGSLVIIKLNINKHRELYAAIALMTGGLIQSLMFLFTEHIIIYIIIFVSGFILSFVMPLTESVFSDLSKRSKENEMYVLSLSRMMSSLAYIFGPLLVGYLASYFQFTYVFSLLGIIMTLSGLFLLLIPNKLKLPRSELKTL